MNYFVLWFVKLTGALPCWLYIKPKLYYAEDARRPKHGHSAVIISNHTSLWDFILVLLVFPIRTVRYLMAELLFLKSKAMKRLLYDIGGIHVDRNDPTDIGYMPGIRDALVRRQLIGIFPEGRINDHPDSGLLPFKSGAAYVALKYGVPVLPCCSSGKYRLFGRTKFIIGKEIDLRAIFGSEVTNVTLAAANEYLRDSIASLRGELEQIEKKEAKRREIRRYRARQRVSLRHWFDKFFQYNMWLGLAAAFRPKYIYTDRKAQGRRLPDGAVVICNHTSFYDPPTLCQTFKCGRLHVLAGEVLYEKPALRWLLDHTGSVKIDREAIDMSCIRRCEELLAHGESVGIFPEGTINESGGLMPFKAGVALMAIRADVPVIPVYICGKYEYFKHRQRIIIGEPIILNPYGQPITADLLASETARLEESMRRLQGGAQKIPAREKVPVGK